MPQKALFSIPNGFKHSNNLTVHCQVDYPCTNGSDITLLYSKAKFHIPISTKFQPGTVSMNCDNKIPSRTRLIMIVVNKNVLTFQQISEAKGLLQEKGNPTK